MRRSLIAGATMLAAAVGVAGFSGMGLGAPTPGGGAVVNNRVLVVPFATLNVSPDQQWMGKAVQETIVADLGRTDAYSPVEFSGQVVVEDNATAAKLARDGGEGFAVRGAAQVVNAQVRLTAQMIDAKTGDTVATGITTGRIDDLLKMEDDLANQLRIGPVPAAAAANGVRVYTTPSNTYPQQANGVPAAGNMNQPLNQGTAPVAGSDYQDFGAPAYYYSPVYTPSYLDQEPYTYGPVYDYPYSYYGGYPAVGIGIGVGVGGFHRGFGVGGFHGVVGGFHGGFHSGGGFSGGRGHR